MGNDLNKTGNFTSISQKTAIIVQELHYFLLENLAQDEIIILECLEILITHTKYDTLTKGLDILREILERIRDIYASDSRETRVKVQGIKVLQELLSLKISDALDLDILQDLQSRFLKQDQDLKISVYKVLSVFFRNYDSENLYKIWEVSREELDNGCIDKYDGVREFTLKAILEYAKRLKDSMEIERPGNSPEEDIDKQVDWWVQVMKWVLPLINDTSDFVRSAGLEVLSQLSSKVFGKLPSKLVLTLQSIGIGMLSDSNSNVRASACGFLGVLITFESVQKDLLFFSDLIVRIPRITMEDDALVVKVRGSWALANICAAFVDIRKKDLEDFSIPDGYLRKCVEAALFASKDKEKCRSNGVRALGNIFHVLPKEWVQSEVEGLVKEIIEVLIKNINTGPVKTRWNACHAIANILKSCHFPVRRASFTDLLLKSLQEAMISSKNFKVRIAATTALGAVKKSWFGPDTKLQADSIKAMLANLELAMTSTDDLVGSDFGEFRYQQQLREQIISTQTHFAQLKLNQVAD